MLDFDRIKALVEQTERIVKEEIPGAIVECGVYKGGAMMAIAFTLLELGVKDRELYLLDTFEGMVRPEEVDVSFEHWSALGEFEVRKTGEDRANWCYAPLDEVVSNMNTTDYPEDLIYYVQGKVEDKLADCAPHEIALLHLDTDWYRSTKHEMEHLFPRLAPKGAAIVDDYQYWAGSKKAVDEYLEQNYRKWWAFSAVFPSVIMVKGVADVVAE